MYDKGRDGIRQTADREIAETIWTTINHRESKVIYNYFWKEKDVLILTASNIKGT